MTMQRVVVDQAALPSYLKKGYALVEGHSAAAELGPAWQLLPKEERDKLVLVEIDAAEHRKHSAPDRLFHCALKAVSVCFEALIRPLDVLEHGSTWTVCAHAVRDEGPLEVLTQELAESPREAVLKRRHFIRSCIEDMRRHADALEAFLVANEEES